MARTKKNPLGTENDQMVGLYAEGWEERCEKRRKIQAIIEIERQYKAVQSEDVQSETS